MKKIPLTQSKSVLVDDKDFEYLNQWKWFLLKKHDHYYARRNQSRREITEGHRKTILMHRIIMGSTESENVDHIDGNGLNCQRYNMRNCSNSQNSMNKKSKKGSTSTYLGVSYKKEKKLFVAQIQPYQKKIHLGYYKTEREAALTYNEAALKYFGEFAKLNLITKS